VNAGGGGSFQTPHQPQSRAEDTPRVDERASRQLSSQRPQQRPPTTSVKDGNRKKVSKSLGEVALVDGRSSGSSRVVPKEEARTASSLGGSVDSIETSTTGLSEAKIGNLRRNRQQGQQTLGQSGSHVCGKAGDQETSDPNRGKSGKCKVAGPRSTEARGHDVRQNGGRGSDSGGGEDRPGDDEHNAEASVSPRTFVHGIKSQSQESLDFELEAAGDLGPHGLIKKRLILSGDEADGEDLSLVYILERPSAETKNAGWRYSEANIGAGKDGRLDQLFWKQEPLVSEAATTSSGFVNEAEAVWRPEATAAAAAAAAEVTAATAAAAAAAATAAAAKAAAWRMEAPAAAAQVAVWPTSRPEVTSEAGGQGELTEGRG
jgi:hypothetical protein